MDIERVSAGSDAALRTRAASGSGHVAGTNALSAANGCGSRTSVRPHTRATLPHHEASSSPPMLWLRTQAMTSQPRPTTVEPRLGSGFAHEAIPRGRGGSRGWRWGALGCQW